MDDLLKEFKENLLKFDSEEKVSLKQKNIELQESIDELKNESKSLQDEISALKKIASGLRYELACKQYDLDEITQDATQQNVYVLVRSETEDVFEEGDAYEQDIYKEVHKETVVGVFSHKYLAKKYKDYDIHTFIMNKMESL